MKVYVSIALLWINVLLVTANTFFVKEDGDDSNAGNSWSDAFATVPKALAAANSGDAVWVARGIYYPTPTTNRSISFTLKPGVHLYGGFVEGDNALDDRVDFEDGGANQTILSGDIGVIGDNTDNSLQVVNANSMWEVANFDGFVVADGNGNTGSSTTDGVGITVAGALDIRNCTIKNCISGKKGGGIYLGSGTFSVVKTDVKYCQAEEGGGIYFANAGGTLTFKGGHVDSNTSTLNGGGLYLGATSTFDASQVINNTTAGLGGGLLIPSSSNTTVRYSLVANNSASDGGGVYVSGGSGTDINNNMIVNNYASGNGAGFYFTLWGSVTLVNNTIANNEANTGLGGGLYSINYSNLYALNNIFYGNSLVQIALGNSNNGLTLGYCYVQGGEGGIDDGGNTFAYLDGSFAATCVAGVINFINPTTSIGLNPLSPAYNEANWALDPGSVCIDAGTPTSATGTSYPCFFDNAGDYEVRISASVVSDIPEICPNGLGRINGTIDIGAFENGGLVTSIGTTNPEQLEASLLVLDKSLSLVLKEDAEVAIISLAGQVVSTNALREGYQSIPLNVPAGIYIVKIQNFEGEVKASKIVMH